MLLLLQVDDLIATGGTLKAGINLMSEWPTCTSTVSGSSGRVYSSQRAVAQDLSDL